MVRFYDAIKAVGLKGRDMIGSGAVAIGGAIAIWQVDEGADLEERKDATEPGR